MFCIVLKTFISDSFLFNVINTNSCSFFFSSTFAVLVPREITCMNGCPPFWDPQGLCTREAYSSWTFISQRIIHSSHQRYATAGTSYLISKLHQLHRGMIEKGRIWWLSIVSWSLQPATSGLASTEVYMLLICQGFSSDLGLKGCQFP